MAHPLSSIVLEFAKANGFQPVSTDESLEQSITRVMKQFNMDREDAELWINEQQREELEEFYWKRFQQRPSTP